MAKILFFARAINFKCTFPHNNVWLKRNSICIYTPHNEVEGNILESPWLSVLACVRGHNFVRSFSPTVLYVLL